MLSSVTTLLGHLLIASWRRGKLYSQRRFIEVEDSVFYFSVDSATNIAPSRLAPGLRDQFSSTPGRVPLETLVAEFSADGRLRFGEGVEFDPRCGWILGRRGAARVLGLCERQIRRTLEREDAWAPRVGRVRAYCVSSLEAWSDTRAPIIAASHQTAARLPRGAAAAARRCE